MVVAACDRRGIIEKNGREDAHEAMTVLRTEEGKNFYPDSEGGCWRV